MNTEKQISVLSSDDFSDALKKSADGWWRTQSATMALLKHAYHLIGLSEQRIAEQDRRIRQLEDLAATDALTGLMNRRGFEKFFEHELGRIRRGHSPGALMVLVDLDRFKPINDLYGHLAGDYCLQQVSKKLLESIRMLDGAARIGGDEFALLLTQFEPEKSTFDIQKLRRNLNEITVNWHGRQLSFGASIGVEVVTANSEYPNVYKAADTALYADKGHRKNSN